MVIAVCLITGLTACIDNPLSGGPSPVLTSVSVTGVVNDSAQPLEAAQVQVVSGGLLHTTTTNAVGLYSLSGLTVLSGPLTVRASKPGFISGSQTSQATQSGATLQVDFTLFSSGAAWDLAGEHTLTLTADAACGMLPDVARSRTYVATAGSTSDTLFAVIRLSGASVFPRHDRMLANVATPGLLAVPSPDDGFPVVEVLQDASHVSFHGEAAIAEWSNDISARFAGNISYCSAGASPATSQYPVCIGQYVQCPSASHQLRLTRR